MYWEKLSLWGFLGIEYHFILILILLLGMVFQNVKSTQNAGGYFSMLKNWLLAMASFKGARSFNFTF